MKIRILVQKVDRAESRLRPAKGSGLIEVCVGAIFLVLLGLVALDIGVVVLGGNEAGGLAKQAARAAGNATSQAAAQAAVADVTSQIKPGQMYQSASLVMDRYDNVYNGLVHVNCSLTLQLPVSVPLLNVGPTFVLKSQATAPILGITPPPPG